MSRDVTFACQRNISSFLNYFKVVDKPILHFKKIFVVKSYTISWVGSLITLKIIPICSLCAKTHLSWITLTHMRQMSTYVDLILNRVEFKIMVCILLEKTVYHIAALKYTIASCVNVMALCTYSIEIILNVTLR